MEEQNNNFEQFRNEIKKVGEKRHHKIKGSYGVYDCYKWLRKRHWIDIGERLTEKDFYMILRMTCNLVAKNISMGEDLNLPYRMGIIELRKNPTDTYIKDGKVETTMPIDWDSTLKLWYEDKNSFIQRKLVRLIENEVFKIIHNKTTAQFKNKSFFRFKPNRDMKIDLKRNIREGKVDAFLFRKKYK